MNASEPIVHRLNARSRPALLAHFLALPDADRRLRFGVSLSAEAIERYVEQIDFDSDAVFAVLGNELEAIGAAHLAVQPGSAEVGVSVLPGHRGSGVGTALFAHAEQHARNRFISRLFMHCLHENAPMMRIARRAGMAIVVDAGDADALLELSSPTPESLADEFVRQRVALFDYGMKSQLATLRHVSDAAIGAIQALAAAPGDGPAERESAGADADADAYTVEPEAQPGGG